MTHDELLAHINSKLKFCTCDRWIKKCWEDDNQPWLALRAVVELHKPVQGRSDISTYDYVGCDACVEWSHDGNMNLKYPCPTIQAIEEQLK